MDPETNELYSFTFQREDRVVIRGRASVVYASVCTRIGTQPADVCLGGRDHRGCGTPS